MKKIVFLLFALALPLVAQVSPPSSQSRVAGRFVAYNYGQWALPIYQFPGGTGSLTFTLNSATVTLADGRQIMPFSTNAPITVGNQTVTPSAVGAGCKVGAQGAGICAITATFSVAPTSPAYAVPATFGLQEALNDAAASGGGAVTIDSAWVGLGGNDTIKNAATVPSGTGIEDVRTGVPSSGGGGVQVATHTLTSSNLLNLSTTPVVFSEIAAPPAGQYIKVLGGSAEYVFGTTAYTIGSDGGIFVTYTTDTTNVPLALVSSSGSRAELTGFVDQSANTLILSLSEFVAILGGVNQALPSASANASTLSIGGSGGNPVLTLGDGTVKITLYWEYATL